jgi:hypothetical protein
MSMTQPIQTPICILTLVHYTYIRLSVHVYSTYYREVFPLVYINIYVDTFLYISILQYIQWPL